MRDWNEGWEEVARDRRNQFLVITFEAMETDREGVLQKALRHWGIKQVKPFVDIHSRYPQRLRQCQPQPMRCVGLCGCFIGVGWPHGWESTPPRE